MNDKFNQLKEGLENEAYWTKSKCDEARRMLQGIEERISDFASSLDEIENHVDGITSMIENLI